MLHPAIELVDSNIHGKGLIARRPIPCDEVVWQLDEGCEIVPCAEMRDWTPEEVDAFRLVAYQYDADSFLVCSGQEKYMNHSCDPNTWWRDSHTLVARRDIEPGQEVTYDYATTEVAVEMHMECRCGSPRCRGVITHRDCLDPEWQAGYGDHLPEHTLRVCGKGSGKKV